MCFNCYIFLPFRSGTLATLVASNELGFFFLPLFQFIHFSSFIFIFIFIHFFFIILFKWKLAIFNYRRRSKKASEWAPSILRTSVWMKQLDLLYRLVISKFYYLIVPLFFIKLCSLPATRLAAVSRHLGDFLKENQCRRNGFIYFCILPSNSCGARTATRYSGDFKSSFREASW